MTTEMEFSTDGINWILYNGANLPLPTGNVTIQIRYAATATHNAGPSSTFVFTIPVLSSIAITTPATKLIYKVGESLDITGMVVMGTYSDTSTRMETISYDNVSGFDSSVVDEVQTLTISIGGITTTYDISIIPLTQAGDLLDADNGITSIGVLFTRDGNLYYNEANADVEWGSETLIASGVTEGSLDIDNTGKPHIAYTTSGKIGYRMFNDSSWTSEVLIESNNAGTCYSPDITLDENGYAHITYKDTLGNVGNYTDAVDIMYANNISGNFNKTLICNGAYDYYGGGSGRGQYYDKKAYIAVDPAGNYFISTHQRIYDKWMGGQDTTHYLIVSSPLGYGEISNYRNDIFDVYDIKENDGKLVLLYYHSGYKTAELTSSSGTISFTNIISLTGGTVSSVVTDGTDVVVGGTNSSKLQTHYNGIAETYDDIPVKGERVSVLYINGEFYAVYTDSSTNNINIRNIEEPVVLSSIEITNPATKLLYKVGDSLDITGLEVTGTYSDSSTQVETLTTANITGFDSSAVADDQVLTVTVGGETTTYTIDIEKADGPELDGVTMDDDANTLTGMTTAMEFSTNGTDWTLYNGSNLPDLTGNISLQVRFVETETHCAGEITSFEFTYVEPEPEASPTASNVTITGTAKVGQTLTGDYLYDDANGDLEENSIYKWYADGVEISGANQTTYLLTSSEEGKKIKFEVTPVAETGETTGASVQSDETVKVSPETTYFTFNTSTGTITDYNEVAGGNAVNIPETIDGVIVTTIGTNAFDFKPITSVEIPVGVTTIEHDAFHSCSNLTSVTIPNSITNIDYSAFSWCSSLNNIVIPSDVTLGHTVFLNCTNMTNITIGEDVVIGDYMLNMTDNNFRDAYILGGAGTYTGTMAGAWTKNI
jgi:hypothetical protein